MHHFFTCLTTALLFGKVNYYCFEDFAHRLTLLPSTHTHLHSKNPVTSTQCVAAFSHSIILIACWVNGTSQQTARCCSDWYWVVHCLYLTGNTLPYSRLCCLFCAHHSGNSRLLKDKPPFPPTSLQLYFSLIFKICTKKYSDKAT